MGEADEVEAYASASAQAYLDSVDNTLVEQVLSEGSRNTPAVEGSPLSGWLLDVGAGPGGIPLKIVRRCRNLCAVGVDRSLNMVRAARKCAAEQGLAVGVLYHMMQVIPETIWGGVVLARVASARRGGALPEAEPSIDGPGAL